MNVDHDETRRNVLRNALALSLVGLVFLSLWVWHRMPIYPEDSGPAIYSRSRHNLWPLCLVHLQYQTCAFGIPAAGLVTLGSGPTFLRGTTPGTALYGDCREHLSCRVVFVVARCSFCCCSSMHWIDWCGRIKFGHGTPGIFSCD